MEEETPGVIRCWKSLYDFSNSSASFSRRANVARVSARNCHEASEKLTSCELKGVERPSL